MSDEPIPQSIKPRQGQELRFDNLKKALDEQKAGRVSANYGDSACNPMSSTRNRHSNDLQGFDKASRNGEEC
jgi:hypothetical protein